jgi:hypothetical protein
MVIKHEIRNKITGLYEDYRDVHKCSSPYLGAKFEKIAYRRSMHYEMRSKMPFKYITYDI